MSFFQPLITTAFSSYTVNRGASFGRTQEAAENSDANAAASVGIASPSQQTQSTHEIEKSTDSTWNDLQRESDFSKPRSESGDVLDLSQKSLELLEAKESLNQEAQKATDDALFDQGVEKRNDSTSETSSAISLEEPETKEAQAAALSSGESELTSEEQEQIEELKARDAEVRLHEQQHVSAGGAYVTSGPSYTYQTGPDGKKYAIGGEVGIDISPVEGDPEATIRKMQTVAAAAMAPAEPSSQDYKVAQSARQTESQARSELSEQHRAEMSGGNETEDGTVDSKSGRETATAASESRNPASMRGDSAQGNESRSSASSISVNSAPEASPFSAASQYKANSTAAQPIAVSTERMVSGQTSGSLFSAFA